MITDIIQSDAFVDILTLVVVSVFSFVAVSIKNMLKSDKQTAEAFDVVTQAALTVYRDYVADIKKGREDGKLTEEEKAEARKKAREETLKIVQGRPLHDVFVGMSGTAWDVLIEKAVNYLKK